MGELIRNIREIKLGNETLMIEENEGYSASQGKLIHIQNRDFRYLLTEKAFVQLLATILRAKEEKDYYKSTYPRVSEKERSRTFVPDTGEAGKTAARFARHFENKGIRYRFVESGAQFATFLVNSEDQKKFAGAMKKLRGVRKLPHVFGKEQGYEFLYQMRPFELYLHDGIFIEVYFQVPCMSLTPKTWIPLDRRIQRRAWEQNEKKNGYCVLDPVTFYIYRLCWAVFRRGFFSDHDKEILNRYEDALADPAMKELLDVVFFGFTPSLTALLKDRKYDSVIDEYYRFDQY